MHYVFHVFPVVLGINVLHLFVKNRAESGKQDNARLNCCSTAQAVCLAVCFFFLLPLGSRNNGSSKHNAVKYFFFLLYTEAFKARIFMYVALDRIDLRVSKYQDLYWCF